MVLPIKGTYRDDYLLPFEEPSEDIYNDILGDIGVSLRNIQARLQGLQSFITFNDPVIKNVFDHEVDEIIDGLSQLILLSED